MHLVGIERLSDMQKFEITLTDFRITDMQITLHFENEGNTHTRMTVRSNAFEPTNREDPTLLVKSEIEYYSDQTDEIKIKCSAEHVFTFDPIPEDRLKDTAAPCNQIIADNMGKKIEVIIRDMGYEFSAIKEA